jgi:hypothetical protein
MLRIVLVTMVAPQVFYLLRWWNRRRARDPV